MITICRHGQRKWDNDGVDQVWFSGQIILDETRAVFIRVLSVMNACNYLVPRHVYDLRLRLERTSAELQRHSAAAVHQQIEPTVFPGQREPFGRDVRTDSDAH